MMNVQALSAAYGGKPVVHGVNTSAASGELIALIGPNGSGKSTLMKCLAGLKKPSSGTVTLGPTDIHAMPLKSRAKQIAYLAQSREAVPAMTAEDVVRLGRAPYRGPLGKISAEGEAAIASALSRTQSTALKDRRFDTLSGGEQARILLARALAVGAPVLLADEPIAALDPYYQVSTMQILKAEADAGELVITALHDLALAQQFADRIWVMHEGRLVSDEVEKDALTPGILKTVFGIRAPKGGFQTVQVL